MQDSSTDMIEQVELTVLVYLKEPMKSISLKTVCMVGTQHFSAPRPTSTMRPPGATASRAVCTQRGLYEHCHTLSLWFLSDNIHSKLHPVVRFAITS